MQLDSLLGGEILLLEFELGCEIEQAELFLLFRYDFVEKGEVVAEEDNASGIVYPGVFADVVLEENRGHWRDVFVAEPQVGFGKAAIARLHGSDSGFASFMEHVASKDFFGDGHGPVCSLNRRQENFFLHTGDVEWEQTAVLDHLPRDLVFAFRELAQRDLFAGANFID